MKQTAFQKIIRRKHHSQDQGMALLTAIIFISVGLMILAALSNRYIQQRLLVDQYQTYLTAFDGLEAGMAASRVGFNLGEEARIGLEDWEPVYADGRLVLPGFDDADVVPASLSTNPAIEYIAYLDAWGDNGEDSNGDGAVDSSAEQDIYSIHVAARFNGVTRQAEAVFRGLDVNVWRNAIFGGVGQTGALINGNVSLHGSVHLLGDGLLEGGTAITAMELSGTAMMYNNYQGMSSDLRSRVPPIPTVDIDGVDAETLNAVLRVRQGLVSMSGNSKIGDDQVTGADYKSPVDGTYVTDGWTGNSVDNSTDRGVPTRVTSDNGWDELYDLGDRLQFPYLTDSWRDPSGEMELNDATGEWYSHIDYFTEVLVGNQPNIPDHGIFEGDMVISARNNGQSIYWNATTEEYLTGSDAENATPGANDDYIQYDVNTKVLEINGQIRINGDLTFETQNQNTQIHYTGRAAILVDGEVFIESSLLSCNNGDPNNTANSFPQNNVLGIMATQDLHIRNVAQMKVMGAFYAEGAVIMNRQTDVLGALVANYFDMGGQVPSIYHVPSLYYHLPYGMIADYPIIVLDQVSWREVGID